ncbi:MAG TPA: ScyD/ScyE family protein [Pseudonocardiaceae bacterium]
MRKTHRRVGLAVLAAALTVGVVAPGTASAHRGGGNSGVQTTISVVLSDLDTPRGVIYDRLLRRVLVAEAGEGGPSAANGGICGAANGGAIYCYGATGAVRQYSEIFGTNRRLVTGLASIANYSRSTGNKASVLGLHDLSLHLGKLRGVYGLSGAQPFRDQQLVGGGAPGAIELGQLVTFNQLQGDVRSLDADFVAYEQTQNPEPTIIDADPYGMDTGFYGTVVADAAANALLLAKPDGTIQTLAVFSARQITLPDGSTDTIESVPTAVVRGPDGAFYMSELSGFPYYKGAARVMRIVPGQAPTVYADGFTAIADLTFDDRGRLVVLEMAKEGLFALTPGQDTVTGRLVRVERNGTRTDLATTGLENPGGVAYAGDGTYYVTNRTTGVGDNGQLLKLQVQG